MDNTSNGAKTASVNEKIESELEAQAGTKSPDNADIDNTSELWDHFTQTMIDTAQILQEQNIADWKTSDMDEWQRLAERARHIFGDYLEQNPTEKERAKFQIPDPTVVFKAFVRLGYGLAQDPVAVAQQNINLAFNIGRVLTNAGQKAMGLESEAVANPALGDKRFKDPVWDNEVLLDTVKQLYLVTCNNMVDRVRSVENLDPHTRTMTEFYTQRLADSFSPTNFPLTNPTVLKTTLDEKGANIMRGLNNFLEDLERGRGRLKIRMVDEDAFELGKNIATTPGKVVFRNALIELIQYTPSTSKVAEKPLLIVPPWINKFYILDLKPKNSFIKWAVDQGLTVFVVSWVNPDQSLAAKHFEDYMLDGPVTAIDVVRKITDQEKINVIGYCIGGTLMSATLAYLKAKGKDIIESCTFFTTLIDFDKAGELKVFIDEEQLDLMENHMKETGYLESKHMASVFNLMRANDLIWSFVVNNYYLGKDPMAFDLLYWNADATRMPAMQQAFYLRNMYLDNRLREPGGITLGGVAIDLSTIDVPLFFLSAKDDHIAPWVATYDGPRLFGGDVTFVLAGSGHIAGVINPPVANKYSHWVNKTLPDSAQEWHSGAKEIEGSWWPTWKTWLKKGHMGRQIKARTEGSEEFPALEDAPGSYVKVIARDD